MLMVYHECPAWGSLSCLWDPFHKGGLLWGFGKTVQFSFPLSPFSFLADTAEQRFLSGGWRSVLLGWALRSGGRWAGGGGGRVVLEPVPPAPDPLLCPRNLLNLYFFRRVRCGLFRSAYKFLFCFVGLSLDP